MSRLAIRAGGGPIEDARAVICVPACQEAARIAATLSAARAQAEAGDAFLVLANGCADETAVIAEAALAGAPSVPFLVADMDWRAGRAGAPIARRLALDLASTAAPTAALLSLDADTLVQPGWRAGYERAFRAGFDLVCGAIDLDPAEAALLPPADPRAERLIAKARAAFREAQALAHPDPDNPYPHHGNIGGANFGITAALYRATGGLPTPAFGEDRALLRAARSLGARVRFCDEARVWTSCRLEGRAAGGLADELARNRFEEDPLVDEAFEPAAALALRLSAARAFLNAEDEAGRRAALAPLGLAEADLSEALAIEAPVAAWQFAEDRSSALARRRMRLGELRREWPAIKALLESLRRERGDPA